MFEGVNPAHSFYIGFLFGALALAVLYGLVGIWSASKARKCSTVMKED